MLYIIHHNVYNIYKHDTKGNNISNITMIKNRIDFIVPAAGDLINAISLWTSLMSLCCSTSRPLRNRCITKVDWRFFWISVTFLIASTNHITNKFNSFVVIFSECSLCNRCTINSLDICQNSLSYFIGILRLFSISKDGSTASSLPTALR